MDNVADRIKIFEEVRDMPYRIPLTYDEYREGDQCCEGKYKMFMKLAEKYNIRTRPRLCDSDWRLLKLPKELLEKLGDVNSPLLYDTESPFFVDHIYPEVYIEEETKLLVPANPSSDIIRIEKPGLWVTVDPSWDIRLKGKYEYIYVNEWDGCSPTRLAFPPTKIYTVEESFKSSLEEVSPKEFEKDIRESGTFYKAINDWLEELRCK